LNHARANAALALAMRPTGGDVDLETSLALIAVSEENNSDDWLRPTCLFAVGVLGHVRGETLVRLVAVNRRIDDEERPFLVDALGRLGRVGTGEPGHEHDVLELLLDAIPGADRIAVLLNPSFPGHSGALESIRTLASIRGVEVFSRELKAVEDLEPAFDDVKRANAQAAVFMADNVMFGNRKRVADLALRHLLPTMHSFPPEVRDGGLMFYGPSNEENYQRSAALADRILKGARPAELPVEQPTKYELIINLKTAKALGLTMPESFLLRADEVIE